jgi:hypothetical protein
MEAGIQGDASGGECAEAGLKGRACAPDTSLFQQDTVGCQWQNKIPQKWRLRNPQVA